ncbi:tRNA (adenosine(37)-N6)-threonylcarbamoyltransferase complex dimerization subunit type 1 TsaB [Ramlibacter sp. AW1]|uniref:tRNA (Adenosine(37)-N6)-threonylcarbamoyltransferase complex dimerization subunit type 1 TsaB n=1 Tax=Ramlibacter aurantiacus TaxID=2801330 RepID=A0A937D5B6_9BURK|nr:tRNA (adenosine(37)-N6)-threonylcarbamoyltransferase complex dimerization subunit type 1 TsaB [Ramlibacter aurantiacus]MBL0421162.1 tRNA (adenosine(37)-N6)-threonylcarbamoyltransferase complex dimerization subunit type 1 TsaB [Ramlibacter aurantiacus]
MGGWDNRRPDPSPPSVPQNLLAFDTSTERLSAALAWRDAGGARRLEREGPGGRESSAALIPLAMGLLHEAGLRLSRLDAIVFGQGPGSFTGLRTACAVAQGLAWGAGLPVLPVETLMAVAEDARHRSGATRVLALLDARMDEVYWARYVFGHGGWQRQGPIALGAPESVQAGPADEWQAGNAFDLYGGRLPTGRRLPALPSAGAMLRLAPGLIAAGGAVPASEAWPLYVRDKVAQTTQERLAARAVVPAPGAHP